MDHIVSNRSCGFDRQFGFAVILPLICLRWIKAFPHCLVSVQS